MSSLLTEAMHSTLIYRQVGVTDEMINTLLVNIILLADNQINGKDVNEDLIILVREPIKVICSEMKTRFQMLLDEKKIENLPDFDGQITKLMVDPVKNKDEVLDFLEVMLVELGKATGEDGNTKIPRVKQLFGGVI